MSHCLYIVFFFNDTATTEIYTLSLHDALPIYGPKPDPAVLDAFCASSGLAPGAVCMVGDAVTDAELARAAGAGLSVIVRSGVDVGDALEAMADVVISSVAELGHAIERYDQEAS